MHLQICIVVDVQTVFPSACLRSWHGSCWPMAFAEPWKCFRKCPRSNSWRAREGCWVESRAFHGALPLSTSLNSPRSPSLLAPSVLQEVLAGNIHKFALQERWCCLGHFSDFLSLSRPRESPVENESFRFDAKLNSKPFDSMPDVSNQCSLITFCTREEQYSLSRVYPVEISRGAQSFVFVVK